MATGSNQGQLSVAQLSHSLIRCWHSVARTAWISPAVIDVVKAIFGNGIVGRVVLWGVDGGILATLAVGIPALLMEQMRFDGSFNAWFALGWSVVVLSLGAITLLMLLIRLGDVGRVASLIFLVPGVSALMAYFLFGETLTPVQILGMAVCAGAVLIVTRKWVRRT